MKGVGESEPVRDLLYRPVAAVRPQDLDPRRYGVSACASDRVKFHLRGRHRRERDIILNRYYSC